MDYNNFGIRSLQYEWSLRLNNEIENIYDLRGNSC